MSKMKLEPSSSGEAAWAVRGMLVAANIAAERRAWVAYSRIREAAVMLAREYGLIVMPNGEVVDGNQSTQGVQKPQKS